MHELELAEHNIVFRCKSGSHAYGMATPTSDIDLRGVFIAPPQYTIGCLKSIEQVSVPGEDNIIYELKKFIKLAANSNPSVIEFLFTDDENILFIDPAFATLREHNSLFLSQKTRWTFARYAEGQLKRMQGHRKWINSPQPEEPPSLLSFAQVVWNTGKVSKGKAILNYPNIFLVKVNATVFRIYASPLFSKPVLSDDGMNIQFIESGDNIKSAEYRGVIIFQIDAFQSSYKKWQQYWEWRKKRNPSRASLEEQHGFDTKNAAHLIRLLRMADEILTDGSVKVRRPDADELIAIRNGVFSYDELITMAEKIDSQLDNKLEHSPLPKRVDGEAINSLYIEVVRSYWERNNITF